MFIVVNYKDLPELSSMRAEKEEGDSSIEKTVLVNPDCLVGIMLEYLRKKCKLGTFTDFDLCDEYGGLKGLFDMPTHDSAMSRFLHKKPYYIVVLKMEKDKVSSIYPQVNRNNTLYGELKKKINRFLESGVTSAPSSLGKSSTVRTQAQTKASKETKTKKKKSTNNIYNLTSTHDLNY